MAELVELAVAVVACSVTVDILDCGTNVRPLSVPVGALDPVWLDKLEPKEYSDADNEVVDKLIPPIMCEALVNVGEKTKYGEDSDDD